MSTFERRPVMKPDRPGLRIVADHTGGQPFHVQVRLTVTKRDTSVQKRAPLGPDGERHEVGRGRPETVTDLDVAAFELRLGILADLLLTFLFERSYTSRHRQGEFDLWRRRPEKVASYLPRDIFG